MITTQRTSLRPTLSLIVAHLIFPPYPTPPLSHFQYNHIKLALTPKIHSYTIRHLYNANLYLTLYNQFSFYYCPFQLQIHPTMSQTNSTNSNYDPVQILCPRCQRVPQKTIKTGMAFYTHICFENCGKIYWTLVQCPGCTRPDKTVFLQEPKLGQHIQCKNCSIQFYLFNCPNKQCGGLFYKSTDSYVMGQQVTCEYCQLAFKELVCQSCSERTLFKPHRIIYEGQSSQDCQTCKKPIIFTNCRNCGIENYHNHGLNVGQKYNCKHCNAQNNYIPCGTCGRSTKNENFGYCKFFKCEYCYGGFEFSSCTHCATENFHPTKNSQNPMWTCNNCKHNYFAVSCQKCFTQAEIQNFKQGEARQESCPNCKAELKFYHCQTCNKFTKDSKCSNKNCPKPISIKSYSKESEERKKQQEREKIKFQQQKMNGDYRQQECKVCFDGKSDMVNLSCMHVMMCNVCYMKMQQIEHQKPRNRNLRPQDVPVKCPVCKAEGKYQKPHKYIYQ